MLLANEADLVRRDRAIPGLQTLLDPDAFLATLGRLCPDARWESSRIRYLRYKPGTSCLVAYEAVDSSGQTIDVHATAYGRGSADKLKKASHRPQVLFRSGPGIRVLPEAGMVVCFFPNDVRMKSLRYLATPEGRRQLLSDVVPDMPWVENAGIEKLGYKPHRRYVGRVLTLGQPVAAIKMYTERDYPLSLRRATVFESRGSLRLARPLGCASQHRAIASEWLPGQVLSEMLATEDCPLDAVRATGSALAQLHLQRPGGLPVLKRHDEAASLAQVASALGFACPHLADQAKSISQRLSGLLLEMPSTSSPIHGDFYAKQVLWTEEAVGVLDLDEAAMADPAIDLGNFLAHLDRYALQGEVACGQVSALADAFLGGYRGAVGNNDVLKRVEIQRAAALFRLAPHCFRHQDPNWSERTESIMEQVQRILAGNRPAAASRHGPVSKQSRRGVDHTVDQAAVLDPFDAAGDPKMPFLADALTPESAQRFLDDTKPQWIGEGGSLRIDAIRVTRHKAGRRCMIEYDLAVETSGRAAQEMTIVGKARSRGLDRTTYDHMTALSRCGFSYDDVGGVSVPQPIGLVPGCHMWLQRKVFGIAATQLLRGEVGLMLARRIAAALHKLHNSGLDTTRRHTIDDELGILHRRLRETAEKRPSLRSRILRIDAACDRLARAIRGPVVKTIHRDFYPDHVLADGKRLFLLDMDLFCLGDPALDAGNFIGHVTELSLRATGQPDAMAQQEGAFEDAFVALAGEQTRASVQAFTTLTLARHIHLSTQFPDRLHLTQQLIDICEERLFGARHGR